jgi:hypothetical protein
MKTTSGKGEKGTSGRREEKMARPYLYSSEEFLQP